jgi:hypothetical protein
MAWATNDGREDSAWCIITSETGLAHTGTVVNDKSGNIILRHD